jgi:hypothetical protein
MGKIIDTWRILKVDWALLLDIHQLSTAYVVILSLFFKLDGLIFYEGLSGHFMLLMYQFRLFFLYILNFLKDTLSPLCGGFDYEN